MTTTAVLVRGVIETSLTDAQLGPFVDAANNYSVSIGLSGKVSSALATNIETWIAAHFIAVRQPRINSDSYETGEGSQRKKRSVKYQEGRLGEGFSATPYGQQALALDTSGTLATAGRRKAEFRVFNA